MKAFCHGIFLFYIFSFLLNTILGSYLYAQNSSEDDRIWRSAILSMMLSSNFEGCKDLFIGRVEKKDREVSTYKKYLQTSTITNEDLENYDEFYRTIFEMYYEKSLDIYPELNPSIEELHDVIIKDMNSPVKYKSRMSNIDKFKWAFSLLKYIVDFRLLILDKKEASEDSTFKTPIDIDVFHSIATTHIMEEIFPVVLTASDWDFSMFLDMSAIYGLSFKTLADVMIPSFSHRLNSFYQKNKNHPNFYRLALFVMMSSYFIESISKPNVAIAEDIPECFYDVIRLISDEDRISEIENKELIKYEGLFKSIKRVIEKTIQTRQQDENILEFDKFKCMEWAEFVSEEFMKLNGVSQRLFCWYLCFYTTTFDKFYTRSSIEGIRTFSLIVFQAGKDQDDIACVENIGYLMNALDMSWIKYIESATSYEQMCIGLMFYLIREKNSEAFREKLENKNIIFDNVNTIIDFLRSNDTKVSDVGLVNEFINILVFQTEGIEEFIKIYTQLFRFRDNDYAKRYLSLINMDGLLQNYSISRNELMSNLDEKTSDSLKALFSTSKMNFKIKQLYIALLLNSESLELEDMYFLIDNEKEFKISKDSILKYVESLSSEDNISFLFDKTDSKYKIYRKAILSKYKDISYLISSLEGIDEKSYLSFIYILVSSSDNEVISNVIEILKTNSKVVEELKRLCVDTLTYDSQRMYVRDFLIDNGLVKKEKKVIKIKPKVEKVVDTSLYIKDKKQALKNKLIEFSLVNDFNSIEKELKSYNLDTYENRKKDRKFVSDVDEIISFFYFIDTTTDENINKNYIFNVVPFYYIKYLLDSTKTNDGYLALSIIKSKLSQNNISKKQLSNLIDLLSDAYFSSESKVFRLSVLDFCISMLKDSRIEFDEDCLKEYLGFIIKIEADYDVAFYERIEDLIDIIVRFNERAIRLYEKLKYSLMDTSSVNGVNYFNIAMIETNINLAHLYERSSSLRKVIIATLLSDFCYMYLYNVKDNNILNYNYNDVVSSLNKALSYNNDFIKNIAKETLGSLKVRRFKFNLKDRIEGLMFKFDNIRGSLQSDENLILREDLSISKILLSEILKGNWVLDLSAKEYFGLGYDILVMNDTDRNISLIEAKSKVSMSSSYPSYLSRKQLQKAKDIYEDCSYLNKTLKYHVFLVPLKTEEARVYGEIINVNLDFNKIIEVLKNSDESTTKFDLSLLEK